MKRLLMLALVCAPVAVLAADKTAPKTAPTTAPKTEPKAETATPPAMSDEGKNLKVEEPDQKDPKNKKTEVKAKGEMKKDSF